MDILYRFTYIDIGTYMRSHGNICKITVFFLIKKKKTLMLLQQEAVSPCCLRGGGSAAGHLLGQQQVPVGGPGDHAQVPDLPAGPGGLPAEDHPGGGGGGQKDQHQVL